MRSEELALVQGWDDTRAALSRWNARPASVLRPWALGSLAYLWGWLDAHRRSIAIRLNL